MKKKYNFRADEDKVNDYQAFAEENGQTFTQLILSALEMYTQKGEKLVRTEPKSETIPETPKETKPLSVRTGVDLSKLKRKGKDEPEIDSMLLREIPHTATKALLQRMAIESAPKTETEVFEYSEGRKSEKITDLFRLKLPSLRGEPEENISEEEEYAEEWQPEYKRLPYLDSVTEQASNSDLNDRQKATTLDKLVKERKISNDEYVYLRNRIL